MCVFLAEEVTERDKFMSPAEAKEFGIIDQVLSQDLMIAVMVTQQ